MLQMPPVKKAWDVDEASKSRILCVDEIYLWEKSGKSKLVFTDITYGLPRRVGLSLLNASLLDLSLYSLTLPTACLAGSVSRFLTLRYWTCPCIHRHYLRPASPGRSLAS